jgi:polysaccharide biosynthesis protein PslH
MRILLLTQILPYPPDSGPKIKTYHVLRYLAESGHRVTLAAFVRKHEEPYLQHIQPHCAEIHAVPLRRSRLVDARAYAASLQSGLPFLVTRDAQPAMRRLMDRLAQQQFDIVHADQLTMAQFALQFRHASTAAAQLARLVFDAHNAVYEIVARAGRTAPIFLRPVLRVEADRLRKYEGNLINQFDHTLAVSEVDKDALLNAIAHNSETQNLKSRISVIPIAVDCASLPPIKRDQPSDNILTVSTLFYPPNADGVRWFMNQIFPLVRHQVPNATLTIVGARPPKDIVDFGLRNAECVQVTGYVPDLQKRLERAALMVVPVRAGSGMRVRILEALARGIPVVTTKTGVEGIDAIDGEHLLVANEPREFAAAVVRLLNDPFLRESLIRNGRRLVEEKYDWQVALPKLESVYQSLGSM